MSTICLLGRQPAIGLAELESLYGATAVTPLDHHAALVEADVDFARLGGSIKAAQYLTTLETTNPQKVFDYCRRALPEYLQDFPEGKIKLGVSLYGLDMPVMKINANTLTLKKVIKSAGRSVRAIPNTEIALSSAQTYHNALTSPVGLELIFVRSGETTLVGHVSHVQNIDSYTARDRSRPKRDAFVGMLPPKLAQVIINLANGGLRAEDGATSSHTVLDPFCGTGVILQEAALMGYTVYGTDLSPKMVDYSRANLDWLQHRSNLPVPPFTSTLGVADATGYNWDLSSLVLPPSSLSIACEGYLGQPLGGQHPSPEKLAEIIHDTNAVMRGFLRSIAPQLPTGTRLCIAAPAWVVDDTLHHLPVIDDLVALGFDRIDFTHASSLDLIYRREDQLTGRELLVLTKK